MGNGLSRPYCERNAPTVCAETCGFKLMGVKKSPGASCRIAKEKIETPRSRSVECSNRRARYLMAGLTRTARAGWIPRNARWREVPWCRDAPAKQIACAWSCTTQSGLDTSPQLRRQIQPPSADRARCAGSSASGPLAGPPATSESELDWLRRDSKALHPESAGAGRVPTLWRLDRKSVV